MINKDILENNKLIAEFMGAIEIDYDEFGIGFYFSQMEEFLPRQAPNLNELRYHLSWDWLMPVIDKITSMNEYIKFKNDTCNIIDEGGICINTKFIENTWNDTIDFIKWFNKNKL